MTRRRVLAASAALVALLLAFWCGRWTKPARVEERVRTVEVIRAAEAKASEAQAREDVRTVVVTRWRTKESVRADGSTTREAEAESVAGAAERTEARTSAVEVRTVEVVKTVEKTKLVTTPAPAWFVDARIGNPIAERASSVGVGVSRRVLGPLTVGAWAMSEMGKWQNVQGGVSVGVTW